MTGLYLAEVSKNTRRALERAVLSSSEVIADKYLQTEHGKEKKKGSEIRGKRGLRRGSVS